MSWTKEDQAKLREYQTAQMTVKEIAVKMQRPQQLIRAELEAMGYKPIEDKPKPESEFLTGFQPVEIKRKPYAKITTSVEKKVCELREKCMTTTQIAKKLNIGSQQTVANILKRNGYSTKRGEYHKIKLQDLQDQEETKEDKPMKTASINQDFEQAVDQMIAEAKEKEPAPSANDTSSKEITPAISTINDTTEKPESQAPVLTGIKMMMEVEAMLGEVYGRDAEIVSVSADAEHCDIGFEHEGVRYSLTFGIRQTLPEYREVRK